MDSLDSTVVKVNAPHGMEDTLPMEAKVNSVLHRKRTAALASPGDPLASQSAVELLTLAAHRWFVGQLE